MSEGDAPTRSDGRHLDGRHLRSKRSQDAMVQATLDLIYQGEVPSSATIAQRAGVTQRTLFNQFGDMDSLIMEVARRQADTYRGRVPEIDPAAPLAERVELLMTGVASILEDAMHVRWAVLRSANPLALELVEAARPSVRTILERTFATELDRLVAPRRVEVLDELEIAIDPIAWRMRRRMQHLSVEEASVRVRETITALVESP